MNYLNNSNLNGNGNHGSNSNYINNHVNYTNNHANYMNTVNLSYMNSMTTKDMRKNMLCKIK